MSGGSICVVVCAPLSHTELKSDIIQLPTLATTKEEAATWTKHEKDSEAETKVFIFSAFSSKNMVFPYFWKVICFSIERVSLFFLGDLRSCGCLDYW